MTTELPPPSPDPTCWVVSPAGGERLDRFLVQALGDTTRSTVARWIAERRVAVDGVVVTKPGTTLRVGASVALTRPEEIAASPHAAEAIPLVIVYEDAHLAVIDKPAGLVVHPAPGHPSGTLVNALLGWAKSHSRVFCVANEDRPGIVHRIDKDTSGLLVVAFDDRTLTGLQHQFARHSTERRYRAVVLGTKIQDSGTLDTPYGRHPRDRKRFTGSSDAVAASLRRAVTHWEVFARGHALCGVELALETGRTHQIRVHLSELGYPIIADPIYGHALPRGVHGPAAAQALRELALARQMPRLALHAAVLGFTHPVTGARLHFESPDPPELATLMIAFTLS